MVRQDLLLARAEAIRGSLGKMTIRVGSRRLTRQVSRSAERKMNINTRIVTRSGLSLWLASLFLAGTLVSAQQLPDGSAVFARGRFQDAEQDSEPRPFGEEEPEESEAEEELETDRDSFTPATSIVRRGGLLVESAYSFIDNRRAAETHSYPELLVRYGWRENVELRLGWNYEIGGAGNPVSGNISDFEETEGELEEEAKLLYGAKFFLNEQRGWTPRSSFIIQGFSPTFGESNQTTISATPVIGWSLRNGWSWDSALRYGTSAFEEDHFNVWAPSTVLKIPLTERLKAHVEYFGALTEGRERETTQHFFSPGAHILVTPRIELGIRVGWGLNDQSANFFSNAGVGWMF